MSKNELDTKNPAPKSELTDDELEKVAGGVRKATGEQEVYLQIELENVQITSYQLG
jgi:bacteriocin-like protein